MEDFEREEIRPSFRIGFSIEDLEESSFEAELALSAEQGEFELGSYETTDDEEEDEDDDDDDEGGA